MNEAGKDVYTIYFGDGGGCLSSNKLLFHTEDDSTCLVWIISKLDRLKNKARKVKVHRANYSGQDEQAGMF